MTLVRYNPNRSFDNAFEQFFSDFHAPVIRDGSGNSPVVISPRVEIRDGEDAIELSAEVPGVHKDQLKVEVIDRVLTLSGEKRVENEDEGNGYTRSERVYGAFKRKFTLPNEVDVEKIAANIENGVLNLRLPKKPEAKPKLINIGSEDSKKIDVS